MFARCTREKDRTDRFPGLPKSLGQAHAVIQRLWTDKAILEKRAACLENEVNTLKNSLKREAQKAVRARLIGTGTKRKLSSVKTQCKDTFGMSCPYTKVDKDIQCMSSQLEKEDKYISCTPYQFEKEDKNKDTEQPSEKTSQDISQPPRKKQRLEEGFFVPEPQNQAVYDPMTTKTKIDTKRTDVLVTERKKTGQFQPSLQSLQEELQSLQKDLERCNTSLSSDALSNKKAKHDGPVTKDKTNIFDVNTHTKHEFNPFINNTQKFSLEDENNFHRDASRFGTSPWDTMPQNQNNFFTGRKAYTPVNKTHVSNKQSNIPSTHITQERFPSQTHDQQHTESLPNEKSTQLYDTSNVKHLNNASTMITTTQTSNDVWSRRDPTRKIARHNTHQAQDMTYSRPPPASGISSQCSQGVPTSWCCMPGHVSGPFNTSSYPSSRNVSNTNVSSDPRPYTSCRCFQDGCGCALSQAHSGTDPFLGYHASPIEHCQRTHYPQYLSSYHPPGYPPRLCDWDERGFTDDQNKSTYNNRYCCENGWAQSLSKHKQVYVNSEQTYPLSYPHSYSNYDNGCMSQQEGISFHYNDLDSGYHHDELSKCDLGTFKQRELIQYGGTSYRDEVYKMLTIIISFLVWTFIGVLIRDYLEDQN